MNLQHFTFLVLQILQLLHDSKDITQHPSENRISGIANQQQFL